MSRKNRASLSPAANEGAGEVQSCDSRSVPAGQATPTPSTSSHRLHDSERERGNYWRHRALSNEQHILELEDELDIAIEALWDCMKAAGADTSYADGHRHAYALGKTGFPSLPVAAVEAVNELRKDYDEADA